jgi:hypothetical protein
MARVMPVCVKCGAVARDEHHIIYEPEVKVWLCHDCHIDFTLINAHKGRAQASRNRFFNYVETEEWDWEVGGGLSNNQRWAIWYKFLRGGFRKPRRTILDGGIME